MNHQSLASNILAQLEQSGITAPSDLSKLVEQLPIFHASQENKFYFRKADGRYASVPWHGFDTALRASGIDLPKEDAHNFIEDMKAKICNTNGVDLAMNLAGYPVGPVTLKDKQRLLITKGFWMPNPEKGDSKPLLKFIWNFCGKREDQYYYLMSWLKIAVASGLRCLKVGIEGAKLGPSQLLAIVGPPGAGKTLFITLVSEMFDGSIRNPYPAFSGVTSFRGDLASSVLLVMDDSAESVRSVARHKLAKNLKEYLVVPQRRFEAKYKKSVTAPTFQRVVMLGNHDSLNVFPAPERDFLDKYALLRAYMSKEMSAIRSEAEKEAWIDSYRQAIPAFMHYLIHEFEIPDEIVDSRYGVKAFQDPELLDELSNAGTDRELLCCLEKHYVKEGSRVSEGRATTIPSPNNPGKYLWIWEGIARHFRVLVAKLPAEQGWLQEFRTRNSAGILLASLADQYPETVQKGSIVRGIRWWRLCFECSSPPPECNLTERNWESSNIKNGLEKINRASGGRLVIDEDEDRLN